METCPKKPKLKAMKKTMSALDKATKYTTTDLPKNIGLKELKQEGYDAIVKLTEGQAKTKLRELQLLPSRSVKERECYKCGTRFRWQKKINKHRCTNWECDTRVAQLALTYTPLWHMHRGGTMSYKTFLKALYIFALKIPQDSARHILGCGYDSAENWFRMFRLATAYAELFKGRSMHFPDGTVEFDATKTVINRSSSNKKNTHCGRFLVIYHRESGAYALEPLPDKAVLKGAPPPPESYDEVHTPIRKKVHKGHVLSADSGKAFKKTHKIHFEDKGIPYATVVHRNKQFSKVVRIPITSLSKRIRNRVALLPTTNTRTYRYKAGDNKAENTFCVVKRNLKRMNLSRNPGRASVNFLSAAWLTKNVGLEKVAKALAYYQKALTDSIPPADAYKSLDWLKSMEPMP
jgi:hypothetical protein